MRGVMVHCARNRDRALQGLWMSPLNVTRQHDKRFDTEWRPVEIPLSNRESAREHWWSTPSVCSLGAAPCYLMFLLTRGILMPSLFQKAAWVFE